MTTVEQPQNISEGKSTTFTTQPTLISAQGIEVIRAKRRLLHDVAIDICEGEIVTLIGPNGAGKTTLVRVLLGLMKPEQGFIRRKEGLQIGYVPQRFSVDPTIPLTVHRFVTLGVQAVEEDVRRALSETGTNHLINIQIAALSGGEFQRISLARALIGSPDLLVLDEPVQGVDYSGEAELYNLIPDIRDRRGCGILLVSHDLHVVLGASNRVVCLNNHVCCSGVPDSVAKHPEYVRLFGTEAARSYAIYRHAHDHEHDLSGEVTHPHQHTKKT